jgi:membrane-bound serine protease (ClpP class)
LTALEPRGKVFVHGEIWQARLVDGRSCPAETEIRIVAVEGLLLTVEPLPAEAPVS